MNFSTTHFNSKNNNNNDSRFKAFQVKTCEPHRFGGRGQGSSWGGKPELSPKSPLAGRRKLCVLIWLKYHFLVLRVRGRVSCVDQKLTFTFYWNFRHGKPFNYSADRFPGPCPPADFVSLVSLVFAIMYVFCQRHSFSVDRGTDNTSRVCGIRHLLASWLGDCRVS